MKTFCKVVYLLSELIHLGLKDKLLTCFQLLSSQYPKPLVRITNKLILIERLIEGGIGGYPIPQYRKKKWQLPKYRVENHLNTDTAYFNHIYNRFRTLMVASIQRV